MSVLSASSYHDYALSMRKYLVVESIHEYTPVYSMQIRSCLNIWMAAIPWNPNPTYSSAAVHFPHLYFSISPLDASDGAKVGGAVNLTFFRTDIFQEVHRMRASWEDDVVHNSVQLLPLSAVDAFHFIIGTRHSSSVTQAEPLESYILVRECLPDVRRPDLGKGLYTVYIRRKVCPFLDKRALEAISKAKRRLYIQRSLVHINMNALSRQQNKSQRVHISTGYVRVHNQFRSIRSRLSTVSQGTSLYSPHHSLCFAFQLLISAEGMCVQTWGHHRALSGSMTAVWWGSSRHR